MESSTGVLPSLPVSSTGIFLASLSSVVSMIAYYYIICLPVPVVRSPGNTTSKCFEELFFYCHTRKTRTAIIIISTFRGQLHDLSKYHKAALPTRQKGRTSVWERLRVEKLHSVKSAFLPTYADSVDLFPVNLGPFWVTIQKHPQNLVNTDLLKNISSQGFIP